MNIDKLLEQTFKEMSGIADKNFDKFREIAYSKAKVINYKLEKIKELIVEKTELSQMKIELLQAQIVYTLWGETYRLYAEATNVVLTLFVSLLQKSIKLLIYGLL